MHRKVCYIEQGEHSECGLACAAMLLNTLSEPITLEELRETYGAPRGGLTVAQLKGLLESNDLKMRAVRVPSVDAMKTMPMPCILHWEDDHYIVLERYARGRFHVVDPANGRHRYTAERMASSCTGVAVMPDPEQLEQCPRRHAMRTAGFWASDSMRLLTRFAQRHVSLCLFTVVLAFCVQGLSLIVPMVTRNLVDNPGIASAPHFLLWAVGSLAVSTGIYYVISALNTMVMTRLQMRFSDFLFDSYMKGILKRGFSFFVNRSSGDLIYRANLVSLIQQTLTTGFLSTVISVVFLVVYLGMMLSYSVHLTVITLAVCVVILAVSILYAHVSKLLTDRETEAQSAVQRSFIEIFSGIETIKSLNLEQHFYQRWAERFNKQLGFQWFRARASALISSLSSALVFVLPLSVVTFGITLTNQGLVQLGTVVGFMTLASSFATPFSTVVSSINQFVTIGTYMRKVAELVLPAIDDGELEAQRSTAQQDLGDEGIERLCAQDVGFSYSSFETPVVQNVDLCLKKGEKIAIVGATGSGKSTLLKMLAGLIVPTTGSVIVNDDLPMNRLSSSWKQERMAYVNQNATVFNETLRDNIAIHREWIDDERLKEVCEMTCIDDRMMPTAAGLDTMISEQGMNLSGGQRQKISIARALASSPQLLLMDEPTSALDNDTERRIMKAVLDTDSTCVVVAHRLASIRDFDRIYVMDRGSIVECGTHDELMKTPGAYRALYSQVA